MIAFITGGAGFIGSHLADRLVARGDEVWILDDLSGGAMRNIDHLEDSALFHHRIGSVTDEELVSVDRADGDKHHRGMAPASSHVCPGEHEGRCLPASSDILASDRGIVQLSGSVVHGQ